MPKLNATQKLYVLRAPDGLTKLAYRKSLQFAPRCCAVVACFAWCTSSCVRAGAIIRWKYYLST